jgi:hypothetical protein
MIGNIDEMQTLGKDNFEAALKAFGAFSKGAQAFAAEMAEYSKRSLEDSSKAIEKLATSTSLERAIEVQTEYAKTTYERFFAEANKIGTMYVDFFLRETYKPFEAYVDKTTSAVSAGRASANH